MCEAHLGSQSAHLSPVHWGVFVFVFSFVVFFFVWLLVFWNVVPSLPVYNAALLSLNKREIIQIVRRLWFIKILFEHSSGCSWRICVLSSAAYIQYGNACGLVGILSITFVMLTCIKLIGVCLYSSEKIASEFSRMEKPNLRFPPSFKWRPFLSHVSYVIVLC